MNKDELLWINSKSNDINVSFKVICFDDEKRLFYNIQDVANGPLSTETYNETESQIYFTICFLTDNANLYKPNIWFTTNTIFDLSKR